MSLFLEAALAHVALYTLLSTSTVAYMHGWAIRATNSTSALLHIAGAVALHVAFAAVVCWRDTEGMWGRRRAHGNRAGGGVCTECPTNVGPRA